MPDVNVQMEAWQMAVRNGGKQSSMALLLSGTDMGKQLFCAMLVFSVVAAIIVIISLKVSGVI